MLPTARLPGVVQEGVGGIVILRPGLRGKVAGVDLIDAVAKDVVRGQAGAQIIWAHPFRHASPTILRQLFKVRAAYRGAVELVAHKAADVDYQGVVPSWGEDGDRSIVAEDGAELDQPVGYGIDRGREKN